MERRLPQPPTNRLPNHRALETLWAGQENEIRHSRRKSLQRRKGHWIINDTSLGRFDGIIAAVGTCGDAKIPHIPGMEKFKGEIYHSSDLTGKEAKGKSMIVIGGGASAVEALEFASHEAEKVYILARVISGSSRGIPSGYSVEF